MNEQRLSQLTLYRNWLQQEHDLVFADYDALRRWSASGLNVFWRSIWDYYRIESSKPFAVPLGHDQMPDAVWFDGAKINYAHQIFRRAVAAHAARQPAIVAENEAGEAGTILWPELESRVASLALYLRERGVVQGDPVAACLPDIHETIVAFLASASLGAIWSVCSPDMIAVRSGHTSAPVSRTICRLRTPRERRDPRGDRLGSRYRRERIDHVRRAG